MPERIANDSVSGIGDDGQIAIASERSEEVPMGWYVNANGEVLGPVDEPKVVAWIRGGQLLSGSICVVGSQQWADLASHPVFAAALRSAAPPPPSPQVRSLRPAAVELKSEITTSPAVRRPSVVADVLTEGASTFGRWLLLGLAAFVLLGISALGSVGLLLGVVFTGWGTFGYKRSRRTPVELVVGRTEPRRWAAVITVVAGGLFALFGVAGIGVQHDKAARNEEAAAFAQQQAAQEQAHRNQLQASLLAAAPGKAAEWRTRLNRISADVTNLKANDDLRRRFGELTALRDEAKQWLGQLDTKPPDVVSAQAEIEAKTRQLHAMTQFVDDAAAFNTAFQNAKTLVAKRSWLEADLALDGALQQTTALQTADPSFRALVANGFDPGRKKADVAEMKAGIAAAVAGARRKQAAAEAAENKRAEAEQTAKDEAQTYLTLCGDAPIVSAWDGELIGLTSVIKETANDPDSIDVSKCTRPVLTKENCWMSTCNVRGRNGFGALILQRQTWFYSKLLGFSPPS